MLKLKEKLINQNKKIRKIVHNITLTHQNLVLNLYLNPAISNKIKTNILTVSS